MRLCRVVSVFLCSMYVFLTLRAVSEVFVDSLFFFSDITTKMFKWDWEGHQLHWKYFVVVSSLFKSLSSSVAAGDPCHF